MCAIFIPLSQLCWALGLSVSWLVDLCIAFVCYFWDLCLALGLSVCRLGDLCWALGLSVCWVGNLCWALGLSVCWVGK